VVDGVLCRLVGRFVGSTAPVLATNSSELRDALVAIGLPARKFHYVIYGASRAEFAPDTECRELKRRELGISHDTPVVSAIGRFVDKKGFQYLVDSARFVTEAIANTRRVVFVLFGAGDNEAFLRQRIEQQGLTDRFILPGPAPPESLRSLHSTFDIFVNPAVHQRWSLAQWRQLSLIARIAQPGKVNIAVNAMARHEIYGHAARSRLDQRFDGISALGYAHDSSDNRSRSVMLLMSLGVFESSSLRGGHLKGSKTRRLKDA